MPFVAGNASWSAIGTVTDVIGDRVIGFGHAFYGMGDLELPIAPAYVHTVVPGMLQSFKLSSPYAPTGALTRDESVGIAGRIGKDVSMIPMTVVIDWKGEGRTESFTYEVCRHRYFTPMLVSMLVRNSAWGWRDLPVLHTVRYSVNVDFGTLGKCSSENISSGEDVRWVASDAARPVAVLLNNPLGAPPKVERVDVRMTIEPVMIETQIEGVKLDGDVYRPGDAVTAKVSVRGYRRERETITARFELPANLAEGRYTLTACDARTTVREEMREMPQRYAPRTVPELREAVQRVFVPKATNLHLRLPLTGGGLALGAEELPHLPESRARMIAEAGQLDTHPFTQALVQTVATKYVLVGSAAANFMVQDRPPETLLRQ